MSICIERKDKLLHDVYGEMTADEKTAWENHLVACKACRLEKEKLLKLLQVSKQSCLLPDLSPKEKQTLSDSIVRKLRVVKPDHWWGWIFMESSWLRTSLVVVCLLVLFLGWLGLNNFNISNKASKISQFAQDEKIIVSDEEFLENLEMLQEMEALEKLVNLLDIQNKGAYLQERGEGINHGTELV